MNVQFKSPITGRLGGLVVGRQRGGITRCRPTGRREPFGPRRHRQSRASRSTAWTDRVDRSRGPTAWTDRRPRSGRPRPFHHLLLAGSWEARRDDARARCAGAHRRMECVGWPLCSALPPSSCWVSSCPQTRTPPRVSLPHASSSSAVTFLYFIH